MNRDEKYYDSHAQDVDLEKIASSGDNRELLRMLRSDSCWDSLHITDVYDPEVLDFVVRIRDDLGWLGYFVGKSTCLNSFTVDYCLKREKEQMHYLGGLAATDRLASFVLLLILGMII